MNRSGIKRGLAVSAVAALGVVGVPGLAHAATTDINSISATPDKSSVNTNQDATYTVATKTSTGAPTTGTVHVVVSESIPTGKTEADNPLELNDQPTTYDTTPGDDTTATPGDGVNDGKWTVSEDLNTTGAAGTGTFKVKSSATGTFNVQVTGNGAAANSTLTVGGGQTGNDAVKSLQFSTTSVTGYDTDTNKVVVTPVDANGFAVSGVTISNSVDNGTGTALTGAATPGDPYSTTFTLPSSVGNHTVLFWVNQDNGASNTTAADSSEPQGTVTDTVTASPVPAGDATAKDLTTPTVTNVGGVATIPADNKDYSLPISLTVVNDQGTPSTSDDVPVPGAHVRFDVVITPPVGSPIPVSLSGVAGPNGVVSITPTLPAAADVNGTTISATPYLSESSTAGQGQSLGALPVIHVASRTYSISPAGGQFQATKGGTVNVPVKIADQFGDAPSITQSLGFTITSGPNANPGAQTVVAANGGQATFTYTDTKAAAGQTDTIAVNDLSTTGISTTESVNYIAGPTTASKLTLTSDPTSADTTAPSVVVGPNAHAGVYTVHAVNANGEALTNSPVTVSVSKGFANEYDTTTSSLTKNKGATITVQTNGSGDASFEVGSTTAGSQTVTVTAGGATVSPKFAVNYTAGDPYSLTWSSAPTTIEPGDSAKFLATITDEWGNPVEGAWVNPSMADNTQPGTVDQLASAEKSDANGVVSIVVNTLASDSGTGTLEVKPDGWGFVTPAPATDGATAAYTDPTKGISTSYTVEKKVTPPPPAQPKITAFSGKSVRANDVLTVKVANGNGKRVNIVRGGKVIAHGAVKGGKVVFRVKDNNGNKVTRYVAKVAKSSKSTRVR